MGLGMRTTVPLDPCVVPNSASLRNQAIQLASKDTNREPTAFETSLKLYNTLRIAQQDKPQKMFLQVRNAMDDRPRLREKDECGLDMLDAHPPTNSFRAIQHLGFRLT